MENCDMYDNEYYSQKQPRIKRSKGILSRSGRTVKFADLDKEFYEKGITYYGGYKKSKFDIYGANYNKTIEPTCNSVLSCRDKIGYSDNSKLQISPKGLTPWDYSRRKNYRKKIRSNVRFEINFAD